MKVAFLDRDGTIVKDYPDEEWKGRIKPEILAGSIEGIKYLYSKGYKIIIITNQYIINEGIISTDDYEKFTENLMSEFKNKQIEVMDVFFCPHKRSENCECCKPKTGMIKKACLKYPQIDLSKSFIVGDSMNDMLLAKNMDMKFYGIGFNCDNSIENLIDLKNYII